MIQQRLYHNAALSATTGQPAVVPVAQRRLHYVLLAQKQLDHVPFETSIIMTPTNRIAFIYIHLP